MKSYNSFIQRHLSKYPLMEKLDIFKLLYQDNLLVNHFVDPLNVLVRIDNPINVLEKVKGIKTNLLELRPQNPSYLLDKDYILASMGLLSEFEPLLALKIMKKHLVKID